jgi:hypothetical protein
MTKILLTALAAIVVFAGPANAAKFKPNYANQSKSQLSRTSAGLKLMANCHYKRINTGWEAQQLRSAGFSSVRYRGTNVFAPRCAQFARFTACSGTNAKKLTVRYIKGQNRYVIVQAGSGRCLTLKKSS